MNIEISNKPDINSFIKLFCIPNDEYFSVVELTDARGFSVRRNYPENLDYKPAIDSNGKADNVAVIWVVIDDINPNNPIVPINIRICKVSLSKLVNPFELIDNLDDSNQKYIPIDLIFKNEFFIDTNNNNITTINNKEINDFNGMKCLNYVFNQHCLTANKFYSIEIKIKKFIINLLIKLINFFQSLISIVIKYIIGVELNFESPLFGPIKHNDPLIKNPFSDVKINIKLSTQGKEKIFGFEFNKHTIFIFACIAIICNILLYKHNISCKYLLSLNSNNFMILFHLFFGLVILEFILDISRNPDGVILIFLKNLYKKSSQYKFKLSTMELSPFKIMNAIRIFLGVKQKI